MDTLQNSSFFRIKVVGTVVGTPFWNGSIPKGRLRGSTLWKVGDFPKGLGLWNALLERPRCLLDSKNNQFDSIFLFGD